MKTEGLIYVSALMLISLTAIGYCQDEDDGYETPHESYFPTLPDLPENWNQTPGMTDQKYETDFTDEVNSISPQFTSKTESSQATLEPEAEATTQSLEPEPTEEPKPEKVDFRFPDDSSETCVRACLAAVFKVSYQAYGEDGEVEDRTATIPLPSQPKVGGKCGNGKKDDLSRLILQWGGDKYVFKMSFKKTRSGDSDNWEATNIQFSYDTRDITYFEDAVNAGTRTVLSDPKIDFFESPWKKSYICKSESTIAMISANKSDQSILRIDELQIQPFMNPQANATFSDGELCENDKSIKPTSNVASVAVGATLGCLILIVIIIYAVGRKMGTITDRTGYKAVD